MRSASAMPAAFEMPWPSGPVVVSMPAAWPNSGWPGVHAHGRLHHVVGDQQLGERERIALCLPVAAVREGADVLAQMARFRDQLPEQILDPPGATVVDVAGDLE